jgi:hypothetical protein
MRRAWIVLLITLCALPASAQDTVACNTLPNPVYGAGGSASVPLLTRVGSALRALDPPISVVYQSQGACFGITPYRDGTTISGTAQYFDETGARNCTLPITGITPSFGMMGTAGTLCSGVAEIPPGIGDFAGPVTSWSLIVPNASSETVISAEALYFVYGFGAVNGMVSPWTDQAHLWGRNETSAALIAIALGSGLTPARMASFFDVAHDVRTNQRMVEQVIASGGIAPNATLGFVSSEVADAERDDVRTLAFQAFDQSCGYWPDSSATAFDKRNVRDGHYFLWSAYHFYAPVEEDGSISDPNTARFIGYFTGDVPVPDGLPLLDLIIENGNVPECAMQVWRDSDIGPLYSYLPDEPCGCYYDFVATGASSCETCSASDACEGTSVCRFGFCEVQ